MNLADLLNATGTETTTKNTKGSKPIGNINLTLGGVTFLSRSIWKESTSETKFLNELNDLVQANPEEATKIIMALIPKMKVEITGRKTSNESLADLLK
jgi:hypothetical protein